MALDVIVCIVCDCVCVCVIGAYWSGIYIMHFIYEKKINDWDEFLFLLLQLLVH